MIGCMRTMTVHARAVRLISYRRGNMIINIKEMRKEINKLITVDNAEVLLQVNKILDKNFGNADVIVAKSDKEE